MSSGAKRKRDISDFSGRLRFLASLGMTLSLVEIFNAQVLNLCVHGSSREGVGVGFTGILQINPPLTPPCTDKLAKGELEGVKSASGRHR